MSDLAQLLAVAIVAAALALAGNWAMLRFQTGAKVREERRAFIRELHPQAVDLAVDLDLFTRSIRADVVAGAQAGAPDKIDNAWEGDLLRRVRQMRFGHPDPDVRDRADEVEEVMWLYITMAGTPDGSRAPLPTYSQARRRATNIAMETALTELRAAIYLAPNRDVPAEVRFNGSNYQAKAALDIINDPGRE